MADILHRHPRLRLAGLLGPPMLWLGVAYLGALFALFVTSLWTVNTFTGAIQRDWNLDNYRDLFTLDVYRAITFRTLGIALSVTVIDAILAFPVALYMAKVASPRAQKWLLIAVLTPLWASYLVKAYSWRAMFSGTGPIAWVLEPFGISSPGYGLTATIVTLAYLWLPYMILPLYAGLDRIPQSMLEAGRDLGANRFQTWRRVTWPMSRPAVVASVILTCLPMLGDYFTSDLLSGNPRTSMVGNLINAAVLTPGQTGQAAAFVLMVLVVSLIPMGLYVRVTRDGEATRT